MKKLCCLLVFCGELAKTSRQQFQRLLGAINELASLASPAETVDKLIVACLFEVPWELENTEPHYSSVDKLQGHEIRQMADELRHAIHVWLWTDLEEHYENIV